MDFVAFDVETANADLASICQIGLVVFKDGRAVDSWETLVNPRDYFDGMNVAVHGIRPEMVEDAPTFPAIHDRLSGYLTGNVVAHHTPFDRISVGRVVAKHGMGEIGCRWLDTAKVVRRTWIECSQRGYGLANVASKLGIEFRHHSAGEDARAAGEILLKAIDHSGITLEDWLAKSSQSNFLIRKEGDPDGPLRGESIVFTGSLAFSRRQAAEIAARAGCNVGVNVTKETTLIVVGNQDIMLLAGHEKSGKHLKAEELIAKGQAIRILSEDDFAALIRQEG